MSASRRAFCAGAAPALFAALRGEAMPAGEPPVPSFAKPFSSLPARPSPSNTFRPIVEGMLADGGRMEVHETVLNPGAEPHPAHRHKHEELLLMVSGTVEVTIDGATTTLTPGSAGFWKSMALHHVHNPGPEPAQYFIVSLGADG